MKLSTKGRYGIKAMVDIALEYGKGRLSVSQLAEKQGISDAYLEQIIAALKKAGLVDAARGATGGYSLTRPPEDIYVGQVLRALEGRPRYSTAWEWTTLPNAPTPAAAPRVLSGLSFSRRSTRFLTLQQLKRWLTIIRPSSERKYK